MKDTILLFTNIKEPIQALTDEQAGQLFKAILDYQTGVEVNLEGLLNVVFLQIKQQIDYNNEQYEASKKRRSEAGKKGMESRWHKDNNVITSNNNDNNVKSVITSDNKNNLYVYDNVNVNENDIYIFLSLEDNTEYGVTKKEVEEYKALYPAIDVEQSLRSMKGWLNANPTKRKTRKGIKRFINGWLSREKKEEPKKEIQKSQYDFEALKKSIMEG